MKSLLGKYAEVCKEEEEVMEQNRKQKSMLLLKGVAEIEDVKEEEEESESVSNSVSANVDNVAQDDGRVPNNRQEEEQVEEDSDSDAGLEEALLAQNINLEDSLSQLSLY